MLKEKRSFENELLNIFIGLCKGSRQFVPQDKVSKFQKLGFSVRGVEVPIIVKGGRVTADMVMASKRVGNALVVEWTKSQLTERKKHQLRKYESITGQDLRAYAFLTIRETESVDKLVVVLQKFVSDYEAYIRQNKLPHVLLAYFYPERYRLERKFNNFVVSELNEIFDTAVEFDRIPMGFAPDIDLSNMAQSGLVDEVVAELVQLLLRRDEGEIFDLDEFVQNMLSKGFYKLLSEDKRREISKAVHQILKEIGKEPRFQEIFERIGTDPPKWKIKLRRSEKLKKIKALRKALQEFADEVAGRTTFLSLF
ncbi:MAG: hypothetical protein DRQ10_05850 [Candidatus Hydrothermota bacterium]|nr:MAG: hypothetical protein DRQ10_05850 [Candidatus Hydrothermae bacterium]